MIFIAFNLSTSWWLEWIWDPDEINFTLYSKQ